MSNYQRHRRDDYEYDDHERYARNNGGERPNRGGYRARDVEGECPARSRSRSQSLEKRHRHRRRGSYSRSRSRSRSRSAGYAASGRRGNRYNARRHRDTRSRSRTPTTSSYAHGRAQPTHHRRNSRSPALTNDGRRRSRSRHSAERRNDKWYDQRRGDAAHSHSTQPAMEGGASPSATNYGTSSTYDGINLENLPLPKRDARGNYYDLDMDEPFDKERIHREMEEKLRAALAKEGKVYPPPKPEASHPVFANDGSFIEIFKKMQEAQKMQQQPSAPMAVTAPTIVTPSSSATALGAGGSKAAPAPPPMVGRRRGGKILKTGVVAKPKAQQENNADPKDFWSLYLAEVNKYKNNACESDGGTRPLVK